MGVGIRHCPSQHIELYNGSSESCGWHHRDCIHVLTVYEHNGVAHWCGFFFFGYKWRNMAQRNRIYQALGYRDKSWKGLVRNERNIYIITRLILQPPGIPASAGFISQGFDTFIPLTPACTRIQLRSMDFPFWCLLLWKTTFWKTQQRQVFLKTVPLFLWIICPKAPKTICMTEYMHWHLRKSALSIWPKICRVKWLCRYATCKRWNEKGSRPLFMQFKQFVKDPHGVKFKRCNVMACKAGGQCQICEIKSFLRSIRHTV